MKLTKDMNILIVGLGLIGGSYAMALKKQGYTVNAISRRQSTLDFALQRGWIDSGSATVDPALVGRADLVIFALYPHIFIDWIEQHQSLFKSGAVITDVTGVKGGVVEPIQAMLRPDVEFISAHPMAGRESSGIENCDDSIFRAANYIVVPTEKNTPGAIELCRDLGARLGFARISELSIQKHDEMIAFLSQLTHCIAVSLMCSNDTPGMEHYTGDSFRDLTRIAKINDEMWSGLFLDNRETLLGQMDRFRHTFDELYQRLQNGDREGMREMMRCSTKRRRLFDKNERKESV